MNSERRSPNPPANPRRIGYSEWAGLTLGAHAGWIVQGRLGEPLAQRAEVAVADRDHPQVSHVLVDPDEVSRLLGWQSLEQPGGGQHVLVRWHVVLRQAVRDDDVGSMKLLDPTDPKSRVLAMVGDHFDG